MPTYDYICNQCGNCAEMRHHIGAAPPACPDCGGSLERLLLSAPAVHGAMARGRELAVQSLKPGSAKHASDCPCCH